MRGPSQHGGRIPNAIQPLRRVAKQRHVLLEVNADAAEEDFFLADIFLVSKGWGVNGEQGYIVATRDQFGGQRVIAQTTAAVHLPGATCEIKDFHYGMA